jgi:LmbE family N-acetylglucosaminyl deacetylase
MNVLCIAPHPDDETIGCGGALCLHADKGDRVAVVFLTSGELGLKHLAKAEAWKIREAEARAAAKILGVHDLTFLHCRDWELNDDLPQALEDLRPIIERERPSLIYLPHPQEWHPDHKAAARIAEQLKSGAELRAYEVWSPMPEHDDVTNITSVWERKISALRCHASQLATWPYERAVQGLAQFRGAMAGRCEFAEVFKKLPGA